MMGTAPTDETATETAAESHDEDEEPVVQPTTSSDHTPPTPESDLEVLRALDKFLDDIDTDLPTARERSRARDHFDLKDRLGGSTTTQETLSFDYVREDGIAVDGDSYIGLLKVHPQNWLSLSEQARHDTMSAYMSFLMALEFSVAVPCYPKNVRPYGTPRALLHGIIEDDCSRRDADPSVRTEVLHPVGERPDQRRRPQTTRFLHRHPCRRRSSPQESRHG